MLGSITRACALKGLDLLVSFQQLSSDWHADFEDSNKADGIILLGYGDYHESVEAAAAGGAKAPISCAGVRRAGQPAGVSIGSDNFQGGTISVRTCLSRATSASHFWATSSHYPSSNATAAMSALAARGLSRSVAAT